MMGTKSLGRRALDYAVRFVLPAATIIGAGAFGGCLSRPIAPIDPRTTSTVTASVNETAIDKIDILLMIDNSSSMADKQQVLADAIPVLVGRLVNPYCVQIESDGGLGGYQNPPAPPCTTGYTQEFKPITDIHVGIVSSSLGGHGADACPTTAGSCTDLDNPSNNDMGHLVFRASAGLTSGSCDGNKIQPGTATTTGNLGFLGWDPGSKYTFVPPSYQDSTALTTALGSLVSGVGDIGCGFESQIESWYRFLIEPEPWTSIAVDGNSASKTYRQAIKSGTDYALLQQRAQFLRPDSLVAIIGLTDENDTSFQDGGNYWYASQEKSGGQAFHLPAATATCASDPTNPCCQSCAEGTATGCTADPACKQGGNITYLTDDTDDANLRGWDDKRRFGIDFLYPIERYRLGLQSMTVTGSQSGQQRPNPLYSNISEPDGYQAAAGKPWIPQAAGTPRTPQGGTVFLAYIAGVPWQDIARDPTDLTKGFKDSKEMSLTIDAAGHTTWDVIIGTPITDSSSAYVANTPKYAAPLDPHMIESKDPRTTFQGITQDPLFSAPLVAPTTAEGGDPINGHEYTVNFAAGQKTTTYKDLQYACIFALPTPRDCAGQGNDCDCTDGTTDRPLCVAPPGGTNPASHTLQKYAKAYPGIREFALVKMVGEQGIVASICPKQLGDKGQFDYGYTPAVNGIVDRLKSKLGGQCLPQALAPAKDTGHVDCLVLEAKPSGGSTCACDRTKARIDPTTDGHASALTALESNTEYQSLCMDYPDGGMGADRCCVCEITQLEDDANKAGVWTNDQCTAANGTYDNPMHICECSTADDNTLTGQADGWCYIDETLLIGAKAEVAKCPDGQKRKIRFVGNGAPTGQTYITCQSH